MHLQMLDIISRWMERFPSFLMHCWMLAIAIMDECVQHEAAAKPG